MESYCIVGSTIGKSTSDTPFDDSARTLFIYFHTQTPVSIFISCDFGGARGANCVGGTGTSICVILTPPLQYSHPLAPPVRFKIAILVNNSISLSPFELNFDSICRE